MQCAVSFYILNKKWGSHYHGNYIGHYKIILNINNMPSEKS